MSETRIRKFRYIAMLVAVFAVFWLTFSPYIAMNGLKNAVAARDAEAVNAYIDYEALRNDLKARVSRETQASIAKGGREAAGVAFMAAMMNPMIDKMVQPSMMSVMLSGRGGKAPVNLDMNAGDMRIARKSLTRFVLARTGKPGGLVFTMRGFGWELTGVETED